MNCRTCLYWSRYDESNGICSLCGAHESLHNAIALSPDEHGDLIPDDTRDAELHTDQNYGCSSWESST